MRGELSITRALVTLMLLASLCLVGVAVGQQPTGQLVSITLTFDNGTSQVINVSPQATTIKTPFGTVNLAQVAQRAPTGVEVAANPGAFDGTSYDPLSGMSPQRWDGEILPPAVSMADLFRAQPDTARLIWKAQLRAPLNESNLSAGQRKRLGL